MVPLPWAKGNTDPSATAQSPKAQLMLLAVATPRLLPLGFVGAGAFPAIRLPLLVQAADADSLPPADRDVLLHKAGQHACRGGRQAHAGVLAVPRPECSPHSSTPNPSVGSSWDYKMSQSGDVQLSRLSATPCPGSGRSREQGWGASCHTQRSSPS